MTNSYVQLAENIEKQVTEIEILQSIYSNPNEFQIEDEKALEQAKDFLDQYNAKADPSLLIQCEPERCLSFIVKLNAEIIDPSLAKKKNQEEEDDSSSSSNQVPLEIICRLPFTYPDKSKPGVFVRCLKFNLNRKFSEELASYIDNLQSSDCMVLDILNWIRENVAKYISNDSGSPLLASSSSTNLNGSSNGRIKFARLWIYSHHIYSLDKRKMVVQWAKEMDLRGFSKPGKPGIICVEGEQKTVQDYWMRLRTLNWQRIQVKETQSYDIEASRLKEYVKFDDFQEKLFTDNNETTNFDLGQLFSYLKDKGLGNIFNLYFGVDGKETK